MIYIDVIRLSEFPILNDIHSRDIDVINKTVTDPGLQSDGIDCDADCVALIPRIGRLGIIFVFHLQRCLDELFRQYESPLRQHVRFVLMIDDGEDVVAGIGERDNAILIGKRILVMECISTTPCGAWE